MPNGHVRIPSKLPNLGHICIPCVRNLTGRTSYFTFGLLDVAFFGESGENCCKTHDHGEW
jgi:hypothetical protein